MSTCKTVAPNPVDANSPCGPSEIIGPTQDPRAIWLATIDAVSRATAILKIVLVSERGPAATNRLPNPSAIRPVGFIRSIIVRTAGASEGAASVAPAPSTVPWPKPGPASGADDSPPPTSLRAQLATSVSPSNAAHA